MRRPTVLGVAMLAVVLYASPADAKLSDEVSEELKGYVDACMSEGKVAAKRAGLLTWGYVADEKQREKIAEYKSADKAPIRLAAGLALWRAGAEEAKSFAVEQLKNRAPLYPVLRAEVSVLPDERERELLTALVDEGKPPHQKAVFRYLARQTGPLYATLGDYVGSSDDRVRGLAVQAVRSTARKAALGFIESEMLASSDEKIQMKGIELAAHISEFPGRSAASKKILNGALDHANDAVVERAAVQLLKLHDSSGAKPLVELLEKVDTLERKKRIARKLLRHDVSPPDEVKSLYKEAALAMKEGGSGGKGGAKKSKKSGGSKSSGASGKSDATKVDAELTHLYLELSAATGDSQVFEKLKHMFGTTRFEKRLSAARAMGRTDNSEAADMLGKALFEGSKEMRLAAARSLRQLGDKGSLPALKRSISQERSQKVKIQVIRALGNIGTPNALRILRFNSRARNPEIRKAVIAAVRDAGKAEGFETLRLYLGSRDLKIQWKAFVAVLDIAPKKAMKRVDQIFRNPPDGFIRDLQRLSSDRQQLIYPELLKHETRRVRLQAFKSAHRIGPPMYDLMRDLAFGSDAAEDVRKRSLRALSEVRASEDKARFEKLVRNSSSLEFRKIGAWTLTEYGSEDLEATFRGFVTSDSPLIKGLGAYGLARLAAASAGSENKEG